MKTIVDKIRTIVRLEYQFDDDYIDYDHIDCIIDDWADAIRSLWESYFGSSIDYTDILKIIMRGKEEGDSQEEAVDRILRVLGWDNSKGFQCGVVEFSPEELTTYHNAIEKRSKPLGINIADCWEDNSSNQRVAEW